jgi:hypothetical protein
MVVLARIAKATKWEESPSGDENEVSADAITTDMRTQGNRLSFWKFEEDDGDSFVEETILALYTTPFTEKTLDKIDVIWIPISTIESDGFELCQNDGTTPLENLKKHHIDVSVLDGERVLLLASRIAEAVRSGRRKRTRRKEVEKLIANAVISGRVELESLSHRFKDDIKETVQKITAQ